MQVVAMVGLACACAQSFLDRSGIVPYGGAGSSFPQQAAWGILALTSVLAALYLHFGKRPRGIIVLCATALLLTLAGSVMIVSTSWVLGHESQLLVDVLTIVLICGRALTFQLGVCCILFDAHPVRFLVTTGVLCFALTMLIAALGSSERLVVGYLAVTMGSSLFTSYAVVRYGKDEASRAARAGCRGGKLFGLQALGAKGVARFCSVQILPTVLTGSVCAIEMYSPFGVTPFQQFASLFSGLLLAGLFIGLLVFGARSLSRQLIVVVPVLLVLFVAVPLGTSELFSPKPFFILMSFFGAAVGYLNAYVAMRKYGTEPLSTAFFGQMTLFFGLAVGSSLMALAMEGMWTGPIPDGIYLGVVLGVLLVLLVAFLVMIVVAQSVSDASQATGASAQANQASLADDRCDADAHLERRGAVDSVTREFGLTVREADVLALLVSGYSRPRIAAELGVAESTVKTHASNIYAKMGVHKRDEALDLIRNR